jgi:hypothetical protein
MLPEAKTLDAFFQHWDTYGTALSSHVRGS